MKNMAQITRSIKISYKEQFAQSRYGKGKNAVKLNTYSKRQRKCVKKTDDSVTGYSVFSL